MTPDQRPTILHILNTVYETYGLDTGYWITQCCKYLSNNEFDLTPSEHKHEPTAN